MRIATLFPAFFLLSQQQDGGSFVSASSIIPLKTNSLRSNNNIIRQLQSTPCANDDECAVDSYCAAGECRTFGTCNVAVDCVNPANTDSGGRQPACSGHWDCQQDTCVCIEDQLCPNGRDIVNCLVAPCFSPEGNEFPSCGEAEVVSCVDDYCGGCNAIMFDAPGNQVCATANNGGNDTPVLPVVGAPCQTDRDCTDGSTSTTRDGLFDDDGMYCALDGTCRENGSCGVVADCTNLANNYGLVGCVGTRTCEDNSCGIICCQNEDCDMDNIIGDGSEVDGTAAGEDGVGSGEEEDGVGTGSQDGEAELVDEGSPESRAHDPRKGLVWGWTLFAGVASVVFALLQN